MPAASHAARRLGYRAGQTAAPSRFSRSVFELEIRDTVTGEIVPAQWAEGEVIRRRDAEMTVGERGVW